MLIYFREYPTPNKLSRTRGEWPVGRSRTWDVECRLTCVASIFVCIRYHIRREPQSAVVKILYQMLWDS